MPRPCLSTGVDVLNSSSSPHTDTLLFTKTTHWLPVIPVAFSLLSHLIEISPVREAILQLAYTFNQKFYKQGNHMA